MGLELAIRTRNGAVLGAPLSFLGIGLFLLWGFSIDFGGFFPASVDGGLVGACHTVTLVTSGLSMLFLAMASRRVSSLIRSPLPMVVAGCAATVGGSALAVGGLAGTALTPGVMMAGSFFAGVGMALMALVWMELYARLEPDRLLPVYAMGLFAFAACGELCAVSTLSGLNVVLAVTLPGVSMALAHSCRAYLAGSEPVDDPETVTDWTFPLKPVVLIAVGSFAARLGRALAPASPDLFTNLGDLVVAGALLATLWLGRGSLDIRVLYRWALPLSLAALLAPLLPGAAVPGVVSLTSGAGISCLVTFCMVLFCGMSYRYGISALWLFGFSRAARAFSGLAATTCAGWLADAGGQAVTAAVVVTAIALVACFMWALTERDFETTWGMEPARVREEPSHGGVPLVQLSTCMALSRAYGLTRREEDVLGVLAEGGDVPLIEERLSISKGTARVHVRHIYAKLGVHSREELAELVRTEGGVH